MRIIILATAALSIINITQAAYTIKIPFEQAQGGALPNGSINITPRTPPLPIENWQPAEPLLGDWENTGSIYDCLNWTPSESTILKSEPFNQTADCKQDQARTKQNREQETTTLAYRNMGGPTIESNTITTSNTRSWHGTAACSYSRNISGTPKTYWFSGRSSSNNSYLFYVNGVEIRTASDYNTTSVTVNGKTYKRGTTIKASTAGYDYYEVCK